MGEEYGEERPFPFFCSFGDAALAAAVWQGRRKEFAALRFHLGDRDSRPAGPGDLRRGEARPGRGRRARRRRSVANCTGTCWRPAAAGRRCGDRRHTVARLVAGPEAAGPPGDPTLLIIHRGAEGELLAVANLAPREAPLAALDLAGRQPVLSTEDVRYGGARRLDQSPDTLGPYELMVFAPAGSLREFLLPGEGQGEGALT